MLLEAFRKVYLIALAISVVCLLAVTLYFVSSPAFSLYHPLSIYLVFHGFLFVVRPILAYFLEYSAIYQAYQFTPSEWDKTTVILASNVGLLAFAFACLQIGGGNTPMIFKRDSFNEDERVRLFGPAAAVLAVAIPIAVASLALTFNQAATDNKDMILDASTGVLTSGSGNGYAREAQLMFAPICVMIGWFFRFRLISLLPMFAFIVFRAGTGGRGPFVIAAACLGMLYLYEQRRRFPTPRVIAGLLLLIALFTAVGADRGRTIRQFLGEDDTSREGGGLELKFLEGMDFANMEFFEYLVYAVPQRTGTYEYFLDNLQIATEPIPRALWSAKPIGPPIKLFYLFDYGYPIGMTRSLPGEGWTQLGWLGVIIWCGLWGGVLGGIYRRFVLSNQDSFKVMAYFMLMPMLIVVLRDGLLITVFREGIFFFAPILLWKWVSGYLGIPLASEMRVLEALRRHKAARLAGAGGAPPPAVEVQPEAPAPFYRRRRQREEDVLEHLPPAVARRRRKLAGLPKPSPA